MHKLAMLIVAFGGVSACATTRTPAVPEAVSVEDAGSAYDAALRTIVELGMSAETKDRDAGVIQTQWRDETPVAARAISRTVSLRSRYLVTVAAGHATVRSEVQSCNAYGCNEVRSLSPEQRATLDRLVAAVREAGSPDTTLSAASPPAAP